MDSTDDRRMFSKLTQMEPFIDIAEEDTVPKDSNTNEHQKMNQNPSRDILNSSLAPNCNLPNPSITPHNHPESVTTRTQISIEVGKTNST